MGNIDDAVPFFGRSFNRIYPLIMVVYTLLVAGNFFGYLFDFFGSWKRFKFWTEQEDDMDGFDPSGVIILQNERSWIEQGRKVGEQVTPLARNFSGPSKDVESGNGEETVGMKATVHPSKMEGRAQSRYGGNVAHKYSSIREQHSNHQSVKQVQKETQSTSVLLEAGNSENPSSASVAPGSSAGIALTWTSMRTGFQNFKANMGSKKFLPLSLSHTHSSTSGSLDEIFQGLKRHSSNARVDYLDDDGSTHDTN